MTSRPLPPPSPQSREQVHSLCRPVRASAASGWHLLREIASVPGRVGKRAKTRDRSKSSIALEACRLTRSNVTQLAVVGQSTRHVIRASRRPSRVATPASGEPVGGCLLPRAFRRFPRLVLARGGAPGNLVAEPRQVAERQVRAEVSGHGGDARVPVVARRSFALFAHSSPFPADRDRGACPPSTPAPTQPAIPPGGQASARENRCFRLTATRASWRPCSPA